MCGFARQTESLGPEPLSESSKGCGCPKGLSRIRVRNPRTSGRFGQNPPGLSGSVSATVRNNKRRPNHEHDHF